jgi:hypothetical protein
MAVFGPDNTNLVCRLDNVTDLTSYPYSVESTGDDLPDADLTDDYLGYLEDGGAPSMYGFEKFKQTPWKLVFIVDGTDGDDCQANVNALNQLIRSGAELYWADNGETKVLHTTLLTVAGAVEDKSGQAPDSVTGTWTRVTYTGTRSPLWRDKPEQITLYSAIAHGAGVTTTITTPGEEPARTRMAVYAAQQTTMIALGIRSSPASTFAPVQNYTGTSDSACYNQKAVLSPMTTVYQAIGTAEALDVKGMRGLYHALPRFKSHAANGTTTTDLRFSSELDCGDAGILTVNGDPHHPRLDNTGFEVTDLGLVKIPCGAVPIASAWTAEAAQVTQSLYDLATFGGDDAVGQTVTISQTMRITRFRLYCEELPDGPVTFNASLFCTYNGLPSGYPLATTAVTVSTTGAFDIPLSVDVPPGLYAFCWWSPTGGKTLSIYIKNANVYAGGQMVSRSSGAWHGFDLDWKFVVYGQLNRAFSQTVAIQAKSTESVAADLDYTALLPIDEAAIIVLPPAGTSYFASQTGICSDGLPDRDADRNVYGYDHDGLFGPSLVGTTQFYGGQLALPPGDCQIVVVTETPATAVPGAASLIIEREPCYRSRGAGA